VLLVFWATDCAYCRALLPDFKAAHARYGSQGLTVAAINIGAEHDKEVAEHVRRYGIDYLVLSDRVNNLGVAEAYEVMGTPTVVLVGRDGTVLYYGHKVPDLVPWLAERPAS
jgi:thiol-disulfide isomerase/thioredoxin